MPPWSAGTGGSRGPHEYLQHSRSPKPHDAATRHGSSLTRVLLSRRRAVYRFEGPTTRRRSRGAPIRLRPAMTSTPRPKTDIYDIADRLWETADELRANSHLKAAEYSIPVLGLIFLKFADSRFTQAEAELAGKSTGRREIGKADYQAKGVLYLPEQSRFANLLRAEGGRQPRQGDQRRDGRDRGGEPGAEGRPAADLPVADQRHARQSAAVGQRDPRRHRGRRLRQGLRVLPRQVRDRRGCEGRRVLHADLDRPADRRDHRAVQRQDPRPCVRVGRHVRPERPVRRRAPQRERRPAVDLRPGARRGDACVSAR